MFSIIVITHTQFYKFYRHFQLVAKLQVVYQWIIRFFANSFFALNHHRCFIFITKNNHNCFSVLLQWCNNAVLAKLSHIPTNYSSLFFRGKAVLLISVNANTSLSNEPITLPKNSIKAKQIANIFAFKVQKVAAQWYI